VSVLPESVGSLGYQDLRTAGQVDIDIDIKLGIYGRSNGLQDGSESLRERGVIGDSGAAIAHGIIIIPRVFTGVQMIESCIFYGIFYPL
jgi:hypothetical protein